MTRSQLKLAILIGNLWLLLAELVGGVYSQTTGWYEYKPARQADPRLVLSLADIESHMPQAGHIYTAHDDHVNWSHETTHGINSAIRNQVGGRVNAFYCLNDKAFVLREPRLRKSQVCAYVPHQLRGSGWSLYMAGQREWDDTPLYILDEWSAYINGAMTHTELLAAGVRQGRSYQHDIEKCVEFAGYAAALVAAVEQLDPSYPDRAKLSEFVAYQTRRTGDLSNANQFAEKRNVYEQFFCPGGQCWRPAQRQQVVIQQPRPSASQPPLVPVSQPKACNCDPAKLKSEIIAEIKADASLRGPAGKDGRDGKDGERGPSGPATEIDYERLADAVASKVKPNESSVDVDVLAAEVIKRLPPRPVYFEIKPRKR